MPAYPLAGRTMAVSGASREIGLAIAIAAAARGANIALPGYGGGRRPIPDLFLD